MGQQNVLPSDRSSHTMRTMRYALWTTDYNGREQGPKLMETESRIFVGDRLPSGWVTSVRQGAWKDDAGCVYDGRIRVAVRPPGAHRS